MGKVGGCGHILKSLRFMVFSRIVLSRPMIGHSRPVIFRTFTLVGSLPWCFSRMPACFFADARPPIKVIEKQ